MALSLGSGNNGIAFLVSAGITYEVVAKACSSPQTTELNAHKRAPTLMKWVNIGTVEGLLFVAIAAAMERNTRAAVIFGGVLAASITYVEYLHAMRAGLASTQPGTEEY